MSGGDRRAMRREPATAGLPDAAARERIRSDHDTTLIVEAAAGTGKTTAVVRRVVELLATGRAEVSRIAAITFTERAGGELRLRIREELEERIERVRGGREEGEAAGPPVRERLETALAQLEAAPIGTIHAFCGTILQERPVEAGVDPDFGILAEREQRAFFDRVFRRFFDRQLANPGTGVRRLLRRSRDPRKSPMELLREAGLRLLDYRKLDAPWKRNPWDAKAAVESLVHHDQKAPATEAHDSRSTAAVAIPSLRSLERLYGDLPREAPGERPNWLVRSIAPAADLAREIEVREKAPGADPDRNADWVEQALAALSVPSYGGFIPPGAPRDLREQRDRFRERLEAFQSASNADLAALLREDLRELIADYEEAKRKAGKLDFDDLLLKTRDLLAGNPEVRRELRDRFQQILVDEYQDTDPLQTGIVLLLTAEEPSDSDWSRAVPLAGRLCLVGDPKQSIYRFRRAEVGHYLAVKERLLEHGAAEVRLTTNFRSTPAICGFVNRVIGPVFAEARGIESPVRQVAYLPLDPAREPMPDGSLAGIPTAAEKLGDLQREEPKEVAEFVARLLDRGFRVSRRDRGETRPVEPRDICLLFRRFRARRGKLVPQPYADALSERGIPHSLAAVQSYIGSEEFACLRAALTAVEFPDDELSVYATLRGPLFAIPDQDLFLFRERGPSRRLRPSLAGRLELDKDAAAADREIREALRFLFRLHHRRNHQPIPVTLQQLLGEHRAETGFAFRESPDQVFSNLRRLAESSRAFEAAGGLSFRAFVEELAAEAETPDLAASHAMDEEVSGVRIMTVHSAKGLEFPVVILCDAAVGRKGRAQRVVRPERSLHACDLGSGLRPWDLLEAEKTEEAEDLAELDRLLYVATTRARDLLAAPLVQLRYENTPRLMAPVSAELAKAGDAESPRLPLAEADGAGTSQVEGRFGRGSAPQWDLLKSGSDRASASKGKAAEQAFVARREKTRRGGAIPHRRLKTARALADRTPPDGPAADAVEVHSLPRDPSRPRGPAFGSLVHRVLERVAFDAPAEALRLEAERAARELELPKKRADLEAAAEAASATLAHPLLRAAHRAEQRGVCYREVPLLHLDEAPAGSDEEPGAATGEEPTARAEDSFETGSTLEAEAAGEGAGAAEAPEAAEPTGGGPLLVEGSADLAFQTEPDGPWTVVEFKTDVLEPGDPAAEAATARHRRQAALYARAVTRATGQPARAALLYL